MPRDKEMDFFEHLEELRGRILRCLLYVALGMAIAWFLKSELIHAVWYPLDEGIRRAGLDPATVHRVTPKVQTAFVFAIQVSLFGGIILAFPFIALEAWLFIEPALLPREKKWAYFVLPACFLLFAAGVSFCYVITPIGVGFLLGFNPELGVEPYLNLTDYLYFILKLIIIFGLIFELPLVIMFLTQVGIVNAAWLWSKWRHAFVVILVLAAVVTPTTDFATMLLLAGPVMGLYIVSIGLAKIVEKRKEKREAAEAVEDVSPEPAETEDKPEPEAESGDASAAEEPPSEPEDRAEDLPPEDPYYEVYREVDEAEETGDEEPPDID